MMTPEEEKKLDLFIKKGDYNIVIAFLKEHANSMLTASHDRLADMEAPDREGRNMFMKANGAIELVNMLENYKEVNEESLNKPKNEEEETSWEKELNIK